MAKQTLSLVDKKKALLAEYEEISKDTQKTQQENHTRQSEISKEVREIEFAIRREGYTKAIQDINKVIDNLIDLKENLCGDMIQHLHGALDELRSRTR